MDSPTRDKSAVSHQLSPVQQRIITLIRETRAKYHACTASEIGRRLRVDKSHVARQLHKMQQMGLVEFMPEMPGSIWIIGEEFAFAPSPLPPPAPGSAQQVIRTVEVGDPGDISEPVEKPKRPRSPAQIAASQALAQRMKDKAAQRAAGSSPTTAAR